MRARSAAAVITLAVVAAGGAGWAWRDRPAPEATWAEVRVPFVEDADGAAIIRFGHGSHALEPDSRVQAIAATDDSAIAAVGGLEASGPSTLIEVPAEGQPRTLTGDAYGMALADPVGHLAAWVEQTGEDSWQAIAYDTAAGAVGATLDLPAGSSVAAVDGRQVYLYVDGDAPNGVWSVDAKPTLVPLPGQIPGDTFILDASATGGYLMVIDTGTVLYDRAGRVAHEFGADLFGTFDADGTWVALVGTDGDYHVRAVAGGKEVRLDLPDGVSPLSFRWSPEGSLVVKSFRDDDGDGAGIARYDSCAVPEGGCTKLDELPAEVAERFDSSAWGQAMLTGPSD